MTTNEPFQQTAFRLAEWTVDPDAHEISRAEGTARLAPKQIHVLAMLYARAGETVTRQELMDAVGLSDEGLSRVVAELRRALDDPAKEPRFIKTIPRRGYRLTVPDAEVAPRRWPWLAVLVAVLAAVMAVVMAVSLRPLQRDAAPSGLERSTEVGSQAATVNLTGFPDDAVGLAPLGGWVYFHRLGESNGIWRLDPLTLAAEPVLEDPDVWYYRRLPGGQGAVALRRAEGRCVVELIGEQTRTLGFCRAVGGTTPLDVSPAGGLIVWERDPTEVSPDAGADHGLVGYEVSSGRQFTLTHPPEGSWDSMPHISPDGREIAFSRGEDVERELFVQRIGSDDSPRQLSHDRQKIFGLDWLGPECLVVATDRTSRRMLWLWRADGQPIRPLGGFEAFGVEISEGVIYYEHPIYQADIFASDGNELRLLISSERYDNHARYSPDGSQIAFISNRDGDVGLWLANEDGSGPRRIYQQAFERVTRPYWRTDQEILAVIFRDQQSDVIAISLPDGTTRAVIGAAYGPRQVVSGADQIWFIGADGDQPGVFQMDGGKVHRVWSGAVAQIEWGEAGLVMQETAGGLLRLLTSDGHWSLLGLEGDRPPWDWTVQGRFLAVATDQATTVYELPTLAVQRMTDARPNGVGLTLGIHPGGAKMLMTQTVDRRINLLSLRGKVSCD